jgi:hypothetical protein
MPSSAPRTFDELRDCVKDVIRYLRLLPVPNIGSTKVCVIGGLAVWNYLRQYRATTVNAPCKLIQKISRGFQGADLVQRNQDAGFWINLINAPKSVKEKLVAIPNGLFIQPADYFRYIHPNSRKAIQVDFVADWTAGFLPQQP